MSDPTIAHPMLATLLAYWHRKRGTRAMPARADIEPAELKALLPNIFMVDVEHAPFRLRYRLVGSALVDVLGQDIKGKYLDEMPLLFRTFAAGAYEEVVRVRVPCYKEVSGIAAYFPSPISGCCCRCRPMARASTSFWARFIGTNRALGRNAGRRR